MLNELQNVVRLHELEFGQDANASLIPNRTEAEIARCRAEVRPAILARYERLKARYSQTAVLEAEEGICPGCRIALPRYQIEQLKRSLVFCDRCGRILYHPDAVYRMYA